MVKKKVTTTAPKVVEPDLSGVTIQELESKIQQLFDEDRAVEEATAECDRRKAIANNTKAWLCAFMSEHRKTSYPSTWGTLVRRTRITYAVPKTTSDRLEFFDYLKKKEVFEGLITVHSQTLNSWVKSEADAAAARGDFDFKVPGLGEPSSHEFVSLTRKGSKA